MTPKPPICTDTSSTTWPNVVQCVVAFTMEMPHVDSADTAVKNAVEKLVGSSSCEETGSSNRLVDRATSSRK